MTFRPKFKLATEDSYQIYREVMQIIDACYLDVESYQYKPRALAASVMFLILGKHFSEFSFSEIQENFVNNYWCHQYFSQTEENPFLSLMNSFIYLAFGFLLEAILPTI